jgi:hypothetical protein
MASNSKKTESIRKRHRRTAGKERRRILRRDGSTPAFPIHVEESSTTESVDSQNATL